jgi:hypothetical protein
VKISFIDLVAFSIYRAAFLDGRDTIGMDNSNSLKTEVLDISISVFQKQTS